METTGKVTAVRQQWWLKINTKPVRKHMFDGAIFPHVITVTYCVCGKEYNKRKWIRAHKYPPVVGASVKVIYDEANPKSAEIIA